MSESQVVPLCPVNSGATAPLRSLVTTDITEEAVKLHDSENFRLKAALTIFRDAASAVTAVTKKLSLSNNDEAPSDEVSAPLDLSDALRVLTSWRESGACSVDTQHRGGIGSGFCLGVDASVWAVQSCCCCCWSQAGQSTPGHLTATEGVRGVCFQIQKKKKKNTLKSYTGVLLITC